MQSEALVSSWRNLFKQKTQIKYCASEIKTKSIYWNKCWVTRKKFPTKIYQTDPYVFNSIRLSEIYWKLINQIYQTSIETIYSTIQTDNLLPYAVPYWIQSLSSNPTAPGSIPIGRTFCASFWNFRECITIRYVTTAHTKCVHSTLNYLKQ